MEQTPDVYLTLYNIVSALGYVFVFLRYLFMAISFIWTIVALLHIWGLTTAESSGQMNKIFPSNAQPTMASAWLELFIAGGLFILSLNLLPATFFSALLTGSTESVHTYTVGTYNPNPDSNQLETLSKGLIQNLFALMGLMAFFKGFLTWLEIAKGTTNQSGGKVLRFFIFGALAFNHTWVYKLFVSIVGFDFAGSLLK